MREVPLRMVRSLPGALKALGLALVRGTRMVLRLYTKPFASFKEIKAAPAALPPAVTLMAAMLVHTSIGLLLMGDIYIRYVNGTEVSFLRYYNLHTALLLKAASLISLWFLAFIIFWFTLYFMKVEIDGFTVFSAAGYFLASPLPIYIVNSILYLLATVKTPQFMLLYDTNIRPQHYPAAVILLKFELASRAMLIPVQLAVDALTWFGTLWGGFLAIALLKILGEISWGRAVAGGAVSMAIIYLIEITFHEVGLI